MTLIDDHLLQIKQDYLQPSVTESMYSRHFPIPLHVNRSQLPIHYKQSSSLTQLISIPTPSFLATQNSSDPSRLAASRASGPSTPLGVAYGASASRLLEELGLNLPVAESAVSEFECSEGRLQCLVLARLARVVLFRENTLA